MKTLSIPLEQLDQETFKSLVVNCRIWIIKIEIDVDEALLGG
jgi:hypothetical protein